MIQASAFHVLGALQGGLCMFSRPSSVAQRVTPAQVWPALSVDLRTRVIGLLAQLAVNVVVARPLEDAAGKERSHAGPATAPQNPS